MATSESGKNEKDVGIEKRSLVILSISTALIFVALASVILSLWFMMQNDRKRNQEIAARETSESGIVKGVSTEDPQYLANLVDNLKKAGFILYGSDSDANSRRQKEIFGQANAGLDYVECDPGAENSNPQECVAKGIDEYPTWVREEQKFPGYKSLDELEEFLASNQQ